MSSGDVPARVMSLWGSANGAPRGMGGMASPELIAAASASGKGRSGSAATARSTRDSQLWLLGLGSVRPAAGST